MACSRAAKRRRCTQTLGIRNHILSPLRAPLLQTFSSLALVTILNESVPGAMLLVCDKDNKTPELIWDSGMRKVLRNTVAQLLDQVFYFDGNCAEDEFSLTSGYAVKYKKLQNELYIGGVYMYELY